jgi:hypothetical protein
MHQVTVHAVKDNNPTTYHQYLSVCIVTHTANCFSLNFGTYELMVLFPKPSRFGHGYSSSVNDITAQGKLAE